MAIAEKGINLNTVKPTDIYRGSSFWSKMDPHCYDTINFTVGSLPTHEHEEIECEFVITLNDKPTADRTTFSIPEKLLLSVFNNTHDGHVNGSHTVSMMYNSSWSIHDCRVTGVIQPEVSYSSTRKRVDVIGKALDLTKISYNTLLNLEYNVPSLLVMKDPSSASVNVRIKINPKLQSRDHTEMSSVYIMVFDRSCSMDTQQTLPDAKQACILFLKSLPMGSRFNILCFGDEFYPVFEYHQASTEENIKKAIEEVKKFQNNMGGTNMYDPLHELFVGKYRANMRFAQNLDVGSRLEDGAGASFANCWDQVEDLDPLHEIRYIFLMTDGRYLKKKSLIELVRDNGRETDYCAMFTFGIGSDVSKDLLSSMAKVTDGDSEFIPDSAEIRSKVINSLSKSIDARLKDVRIQFLDPEDDMWHPIEAEILEGSVDSVASTDPLDILVRLDREKKIEKIKIAYRVVNTRKKNFDFEEIFCLKEQKIHTSSLFASLWADNQSQKFTAKLSEHEDSSIFDLSMPLSLREQNVLDLSSSLYLASWKTREEVKVKIEDEKEEEKGEEEKMRSVERKGRSKTSRSRMATSRSMNVIKPSAEKKPTCMLAHLTNCPLCTAKEEKKEIIEKSTTTSNGSSSPRFMTKFVYKSLADATMTVQLVRISEKADRSEVSGKSDESEKESTLGFTLYELLSMQRFNGSWNYFEMQLVSDVIGVDITALPRHLLQVRTETTTVIKENHIKDSLGTIYAISLLEILYIDLFAEWKVCAAKAIKFVEQHIEWNSYERVKNTIRNLIIDRTRENLESAGTTNTMGSY
eukprot:CAMPEP_0115025852 /NCGR_PEP_ID=MMETSP0216-20121206/34318_1 /TAXON_ID=223996 /ORGANISM="Protocruzia adherens, Strain Boccale" /LENGTH=804 /DNA_ID=CAMNT_0002400657 /DNA_START=382 /DNA_END=2796 /DNA_ORIENTATION=-